MESRWLLPRSSQTPLFSGFLFVDSMYVFSEKQLDPALQEQKKNKS